MLVLGKGSNLLVADGGFDGICVRLGEGYSQVEIDGLTVTAGGACAYPVLARRSAAAGLTGLEWAVGIPGSVGGGVRMNAGGHGAETSERLVEARIVELGTGEDRWRPSATLELGYRHSAVRSSDLVLRGQVRARARATPKSLAEQIADIVRWRRQNQPGGQNAGSVFTNPPGDSAGRIIEQVGPEGVPDRDGDGLGQARQLHPSRSGRLGRRRPAGHRGRPRQVSDRLGIELLWSCASSGGPEP